ncbi:MAG: 4-hydroxythreonine-4-phosphate dehydrogenase PdxA, partial [Candidatus Omnitrophica bacterium]|nr:4-hydroxythreonine-4-phosphate dehydrogenase PdxA [Candidatus Omnitrophota bacterium]
MLKKVKIGITMGDPSGIGPEIVVRALPAARRLGEIVVIGDGGVLSRFTVHGTLKGGTRFSGKAGCFPITETAGFIDLKNVKKKGFRFGQVKAEYGRASIEYLDKAVDLLRSGAIDCLVTGPISKESVNLAGFRYSGHTEYLVERTKVKDAVMMLLNDTARFSLVTRHVPLHEVSGRITGPLLAGTIRETFFALRDMFGISKPAIVVCGLNPHASDNGVIGKEENRVVKPILKSLRLNGGVIHGPVSADIAIARACAGEYDAVVCMYHDQALIPLKLTGSDSG